MDDCNRQVPVAYMRRVELRPQAFLLTIETEDHEEPTMVSALHFCPDPGHQI